MTESLHEERPSPEKFLEIVQREATEKKRGHLKIFLGMAAGVGKTYSMLEEAQKLVKEGLDLAVGIVDTHNRQETARLLQGLKIVPPLLISYKEREFEELDLDAIIKLHPQIVLVDELAHSNIPGTRHAKRWQDVLEILENGIDVYSTLNVQHIESLNDVVKEITEISVKETVPDFIVEQASSIHLVDLTPQDLLERLKDGKVYLGEQAQIAAKSFFQKDRLTALREIALRYAAEKVDRDLHEMDASSQRTSSWKPREKLLVAVSHSPQSQKLIRITRRLASHLDATWIAAHVDNGRHLNEAEANQLSKNLTLARILGGDVVITSDPDVAVGIERIAHRRNVSQIIAGHSPSHSFLNFLGKYSLMDKLVRTCGDIDLHVIGQEPANVYPLNLFHLSNNTQYYSYLMVLLTVAALTCINYLLLPLIGYKIIGFIFLLGVLILSLFFKKGPVFFASLLYALSWGFFFVPPAGQFKFELNEDAALLALYFFTATATGILVDRAREHKEMLIKREETTEGLYEIVRQIAAAHSTNEIIKSIKERLGKLFPGSFEVLIKQMDNSLALEHPLPLLSDEKEKNAALWVFENAKEAGWSTDTLPSVQNLYIPLKGYNEMVGVLIYRPKKLKDLSIEEKNFFYTVGHQLANYLERQFTEKRTSETKRRKREEEIYLDLFKSGTISLQPPPDHLFEKQITKEFGKIEHSSKKFMELIESISVISRIKGDIIFENKIHTAQEVIDNFTVWAKDNIHNHKLHVNVANNSPPVDIDLQLMEIALRNLFQYALDHAPAQSSITLETFNENDTVQIAVTDEGTHLPADQILAPFVNFNLMIAQKIAELHHGYFKVENLPQRGVKLSMFLPIKKIEVSST